MVKFRMILTYFNEEEVLKVIGKKHKLKCQIFRIDGRSYVVFRCGDKHLLEIKLELMMTDATIVDEYRQRSKRRK